MNWMIYKVIILMLLLNSNNINTLGVSHMTASRVVKYVSTTIVDVMRDRIKFPDSEYHCRRIAAGFSKKAFPYRMPNVCGCIDGTHVNIKAPADSGGVYVNRHGNTSLNVLGNFLKKTLG